MQLKKWSVLANCLTNTTNEIILKKTTKEIIPRKICSVFKTALTSKYSENELLNAHGSKYFTLICVKSAFPTPTMRIDNGKSDAQIGRAHV